MANKLIYLHNYNLHKIKLNYWLKSFDPACMYHPIKMNKVELSITKNCCMSSLFINKCKILNNIKQNFKRIATSINSKAKSKEHKWTNIRVKH